MAQGKEHIPSEESRKLAKGLAAVGVTHEDIASKLSISADTLVKYYKKELDDGRIDANSAVAKGLFQQAKSGNTAAAIFWLKTRAGWKETNVQEIQGELGVKQIKRVIIDNADDTDTESI
jgi:transposase